jgi:hypothetical protein
VEFAEQDTMSGRATSVSHEPSNSVEDLIMDLEVGLNLLLRLLPSIILIALALSQPLIARHASAGRICFIRSAACDRSSARMRAFRARCVAFPVMAALLLIWPIRYFFYATRTIEIQTNSLTRAVPKLVSFDARHNTRHQPERALAIQPAFLR